MISLPDTDFITYLWLFLIGFWGIVNVFWLIKMQEALQMCPDYKGLKPTNVWLAFIPIFGFYWNFVIVKHVADCLGEEYQKRGIISREPLPGYNVGMTANILLCCALIPSFGILVAIISNISRIIHLVKIKNYISELSIIMETQMQFQTIPMQHEVVDFTQYVNADADEALSKNNPNRFMPPSTPEDDLKRWGKK
ncbi:hypothetical protein BH09BAC5_BH09BAC5_27000 [soil metagenome]